MRQGRSATRSAAMIFWPGSRSRDARRLRRWITTVLFVVLDFLHAATERIFQLARAIDHLPPACGHHREFVIGTRALLVIRKMLSMMRAPRAMAPSVVA